jgi:hypothetical protein
MEGELNRYSKPLEFFIKTFIPASQIVYRIGTMEWLRFAVRLEEKNKSQFLGGSGCDSIWAKCTRTCFVSPGRAGHGRVADHQGYSSNAFSFLQ